MICDPCKEAGVINADASRVYDPVSAGYLRLRAAERHGECWYKDCACQHQVGTFLKDRA